MRRLFSRNMLLLVAALTLFGLSSGPAEAREPRSLFPVCDNGKCGYIDATGKIVIPLQFSRANDFSEGRALVVLSEKFGFIDQAGKIVIAPQFGLARDFSDGLAAVTDNLIDGKWGFVDKSGEMVIALQFKFANDFSEGLAAVEVEREEGVIHSRTGTRFPSLWGYINKKGQLSIPPQFVAAFPFVNGVARLWTGPFASQNKYGLIDRTGKELIDPRFDHIESDFYEGLAPFRIGSKWGYVDTTGKMIISPRFDSARRFSDGLARVSIKNKNNMAEWGFIDLTGKVVIAPQYENAGDFSEGVAWVEAYGKKVAFIDRSGKQIIGERFDAAENFFGGLAQVIITGTKTFIDPHGRRYRMQRFGYIDKMGRFVWKPTYAESGKSLRSTSCLLTLAFWAKPDTPRYRLALMS